MIKQTKIKQNIQQSLEPWVSKEQFQEISQIENFTSTLDAFTKNKIEPETRKNGSCKASKNNKLRSKSTSYKNYQTFPIKQYPSQSNFVKGTPKNYVSENIRKLSQQEAFYCIHHYQAEIHRQYSYENQNVCDNNHFTPINAKYFAQRPTINTTYIGYLQDSPTFFSKTEKNFRSIRKKSLGSTVFNQENNQKNNRPITCKITPHQKIGYQNKMSNCNAIQNAEANHLQKMLKLKEKLRKKAKINFLRKQISNDNKSFISQGSFPFDQKQKIICNRESKKQDLSHHEKITLIERKQKKSQNNIMLGSSLKKWAEKAQARKKWNNNQAERNLSQFLTVKGGTINC